MQFIPRSATEGLVSHLVRAGVLQLCSHKGPRETRPSQFVYRLSDSFGWSGEYYRRTADIVADFSLLIL